MGKLITGDGDPISTPFDANTAKALVSKYQNAQDGEAKRILQEVLHSIEKSAARGDQSMTYGPHPQHQVMIAQNLINRGFNARVIDDQREGPYIQISW